MLSSDGIFRVLLSYVLWAYFIMRRSESTNRIMWRLIIAVQVMAFLIAIQNFYGVGIHFSAIDIKVKVIRYK